MRTNKNGVNKDQKDKVKKNGYNRGQHCIYCLTKVGRESPRF